METEAEISSQALGQPGENHAKGGRRHSTSQDCQGHHKGTQRDS